MFYKMRRFKQELSNDECIKILEEEKRGVLSLIDDEYPYGLPLSYLYKNGHIYFHGAPVGHKLDCIRKNNRVSFCILNGGSNGDSNPNDDWALNFNSVICFGTIDIINDKDKCFNICKELALRFTSDEDYINEELNSAIDRVVCLDLKIDHLTGKRVKES